MKFSALAAPTKAKAAVATASMVTHLPISPPSPMIIDQVIDRAGRYFAEARKSAAAADVEKPVPSGQLHTRAPERLPGRALGCVDRLPAVVLDEVGAALDEEVGEVAALRRGQPPGPRVLEELLDRLGRVLLVRAD